MQNTTVIGSRAATAHNARQEDTQKNVGARLVIVISPFGPDRPTSRMNGGPLSRRISRLRHGLPARLEQIGLKEQTGNIMNFPLGFAIRASGWDNMQRLLPRRRLDCRVVDHQIFQQGGPKDDFSAWLPDRLITRKCRPLMPPSPRRRCGIHVRRIRQ